MPHANNQGVHIYYEVQGRGPPLLLHHGTAGRHEDWDAFGYTNVLARENQLICIDARGHGASDKLHDPAAYDLTLPVSDVIAVLDKLQIERADYFGYSMGGWIGFGLVKYAPQRCRSLILGGAHAYPENMQPLRDLMPQEPQAFAAMMDKILGPHMTPATRQRILQNDLKALLALTQDRDSLEDVLPTMAMPCLLFAGEADPRLPRIRECVERLPNASFFSLPGCDHAAGYARSDLVLPHATAFLREVRR